MQTFLPYPDFALSARCLDRARLNKQLVECLQLLLVMHGVPLTTPNKKGSLERTGHRNHPVYKMWRPYRAALLEYTFAILVECKARGIKTDVVEPQLVQFRTGESVMLPPWIGDEALHRSHRERLLQKAEDERARKGSVTADWYAQWKWVEAEDPQLAQRHYWWPVYTDEIATQYVLEKRGGV